MKMSLRNKANKQMRKIAFKILKPFLPFLIIIVGLFFAVCTIIDAIFIQEVQNDNTLMSDVQVELKNKCIQKSEYLNTCHNYIGNELTNYLLDIDSREIDKQVQWSHLYAIMAFQNMANNKKINETLLNEVAECFESTFIYEQIIIKIETTTTDEKGNEKKSTEEQNAYILVESNTIMGHYKYNYEEKTIESGNVKTTGKVFVGEELIGEKYEILKNYMKEKLHIKKSDIETNVEIVIQAANRIL